MTSIALVLGGVRSGKSLFAERLAAHRGENVVYVATAEAFDIEMMERITQHQTRRSSSWRTREAPLDLLAAVTDLDSKTDVVLLDSLSVWASNRLLMLEREDNMRWREGLLILDDTLRTELARLMREAVGAPWDLVIVTDEVGSGVVPPTPLGRAFRDLLGSLNQAVAAEARAVFLVTAGLAVDLKKLAVMPEW